MITWYLLATMALIASPTTAEPRATLPWGPVHTLTAVDEPSYCLGSGRFLFGLDTSTHVLSRKDTGIPSVRRRLGTLEPDDRWRTHEYLVWATEDPRAPEWQHYDADDDDDTPNSRENSRSRSSSSRIPTRFLTAPFVVTTGPRSTPLTPTPGFYKHRMFALEYGTGAVLQSAYAGRPGPLLDSLTPQELTAAWMRPWAHETPGSYGWHSLGGSFAWRPTASHWSSGAMGKEGECTDVYAVTAAGTLMRRSVLKVTEGTPLVFEEDWSTVGEGFVGEVGLAVNKFRKPARPSHSRGQVHVAAIKDGEYQHAVASHGPVPWDGTWTALGVPAACQGLPVDQLGFPIVMIWGLIEVEVIVVCGRTVWHRTRRGDSQWSPSWEVVGSDLPKNAEGQDVRFETHSLVLTGAYVEGGLHRGLYVQVEGGKDVYQTGTWDPELNPVSATMIMANEEDSVVYDPLFAWGVWRRRGRVDDESYVQPQFSTSW